MNQPYRQSSTVSPIEQMQPLESLDCFHQNSELQELANILKEPDFAKLSVGRVSDICRFENLLLGFKLARQTLPIYKFIINGSLYLLAGSFQDIKSKLELEIDLLKKERSKRVKTLAEKILAGTAMPSDIEEYQRSKL